MINQLISRRDFVKGAAAGGAVLAFGGVLDACAPSSSSSPSSGPVTLRFWHQWGGTRTSLLQQVLDQFHADHPNITVKPELHGWDNWPNEQLTAVASGDVPELALGAPIYVPQFAGSGALLPLGSYLHSDGVDLSKVLYPGEYSLTQYKNDTWILPQPTNGGANLMFYNKTMFKNAGLDPENPPQTWLDLENAARALTKIQGGHVVSNGITLLGSTPLVQDFKHWLITNDAEWISQDGKQVKFNSPNGLETLEWIVGFHDRITGGWKTVAASGGVSGQESANQAAIYNSRDAMYISGPWMFALIQTNAPNVFQNLGVAVRPRNKGTHVGGIVGDGVGPWILKGNKHPQESWELLRYLTLGPGGCSFMKAQVRPSPVVLCDQDPYFSSHNQWWATIIKDLQSEVPLPRTTVADKVDSLGEQMIEQALFKKMSPADAINWGVQQIQPVLDSAHG